MPATRRTPAADRAALRQAVLRHVEAAGADRDAERRLLALLEQRDSDESLFKLPGGRIVSLCCDYRGRRPRVRVRGEWVRSEVADLR